MFKTLITAAVLLAATPALADPARTFTRDGETYTYTQTGLADHAEIEGYNVDTGAPFRFSVRGQRVYGFVNDRPVSFTLKARDPAKVALVASR